MQKLQMTQTISKAFEAGFKSVLVTGKWGVGKTTAINEYLKEIDADFVRISALGIDNAKKFTERIGLEALSKQYKAFPAPHVAKGARAIGASFGKSKDYTEAGWNFLTFIGYNAIEGKILWLDDIERADGPLISILLGEIQNLIESKGCRVIVAANDSFLDHKNPWSSLIEKVISVHINFDRDQEEICNVAFEGDAKLCHLKQACGELAIQNIRAIYKIISYYKLLTVDDTIQMTDNTKKQISMTVALGVQSKYGVNKSIPPLPDLMNWQTRYFPKESKEEGLREQNDYLTSVGYSETDDLDFEVLRFISTGDFDENIIKKKINEANDKVRASQARTAYHNVWRGIHNSYYDNTEKVIEDFNNVLIKYNDIFGPREYNEVLILLRLLDLPHALANFLTVVPEKFEIDASRRDYFAGIGSPYEYEPEISTRISFSRDGDQAKSIHEILKEITGQNGWNSANEVILASASVEEYVKFFESKNVENLAAYISRLLEFGDYGNSSEIQKSIARKTSEALQMISIKCPINRFRIKKWEANIAKNLNPS